MNAISAGGRKRGSSIIVPQNADVVGLENSLQHVGEDVGGAHRSVREWLNHAVSAGAERRDRTQEVAGSSPASSMKDLQTRVLVY
jgi:hypothetical protein